MRILIISIVAMLIVLGGWFFLYQSIDENCSGFVNSLNQITQNIQLEDWKTASNQLNKVNEQWNEKRKVWTAILPHHEIDNIDLAMAKAEQYVKTQNISLSLGEIESLKKLFGIVKESEALTITNIL